MCTYRFLCYYVEYNGYYIQVIWMNTNAELHLSHIIEYPPHDLGMEVTL